MNFSLFKTPLTTAASTAGALMLAALPDPAIAKVYLNSNSELRPYVVGVASLAAIYDSTRSYTEVTGNGPMALRNTQEGANGRLQFSPRDSRLGFGVESGSGDGVKTRTYVEIDFAGYSPAASSEYAEASFYQNGTGRLRVFYFTAESRDWQLLIGENWSLFGWEQEYVPSTVAARPAAGAAYVRIPQVRLRRTIGEPTGWSTQLAAAVLRPVQRDAGLPTLESGVRLIYGGLLAPYTTAATGDIVAAGASLGVSTTTRQFAHPQAAKPASETHLLANAVAIDLRLPLIGVAPGEALGNTLVAVGEWTHGRGYGEQFSGWTGNVEAPSGKPGQVGVVAGQPLIDPGLVGYDSKGNFTPIELTSWTGTLQFHAPSAWSSWATLGYGELKSANAASLTPVKGKVIYTQAQETFLNVVHNFTQEIRVGLEGSLNSVRYADRSKGLDRRVQLTSWYRF